MDSDADEFGQGEPHPLTEEQVTRPADVVATLNAGPRSRKSSLSSLLTDISEMEVDDRPRTSRVESENSDIGKDESDSENGEDDPMIGVGLEAESSDRGKVGDKETMEPTIANESSDEASADSALAAQLSEVGLRRSCRNKESRQDVELGRVVVMRKPSLQKDHVEPDPLARIVVKRRPGLKKDQTVVLVSVWNNAILHKLNTSYSGWPGGWQGAAV